MADELRDDYEFDYRQAKPNRFAASLAKGAGWSSLSVKWLRHSSNLKL